MEDITIPTAEKVLSGSFSSARRLKNSLRALSWLNYLARWVSVFLAFALIFGIGVYIAGKWTFYNPPYGHPVTIFHAVEILLALLLLRYWAWPRIKKPESLMGIAYRIERGERKGKGGKEEENLPLEFLFDAGDPRLTSCLTSALEFADPDPMLKECLVPSTTFLAGTGRASESRGLFEKSLDMLKKRLRLRWVIPWHFWPFLFLGTAFSLFWVNLDRFEPFTGGDAWKFYKEYFLANPYRPLHQLYVEPETDQALVGDSFKVHAALLGPGNHEAHIRYSMTGYPEQVAEMKSSGPPNSWIFEFQNLQRDLTFQVQAGPLRSLQFNIPVKIPPEMTSVRLTYYYPKFMGRKVEVMPAGQGAAMAPIGSTIEVSTRWNQPMNRVYLTVNAATPQALIQGGDYWKGSFLLQGGGSYVISGSSEQGVRTRGDIEFPIQALVDLPPEIEWVFPTEDLDLSSKRVKPRFPLKFKARDDFGLHSIHLFAGAPGRATATYEVATLDGKKTDHEGEYVLDIRPWRTEPICRLYFMAVDNHPGVQGKSLSKIRRLYFQPPGSFLETEDATPAVEIEGDPLELTANELYHLLKIQNEQNEGLNENTRNLTEDQKKQWESVQRRLIGLTTQTVLYVKERIDHLKRGGGQTAVQQTVASPEKGEATGEVADLPNRLEQVNLRLSGGIERLEELKPGATVRGTSALDRQIRQHAAGVEERLRRSREEGERAAREIELAFKELTGSDPPKPGQKALDELEESEDEEGEGEDGEGKDGEDLISEGEEEEEEGEEGKKKGEGEPETWAVAGKEDKNTRAGVGLDPGEGRTGDGEEEEEETKFGIGPSTPSNVYVPSEYTLDPETVYLENPARSLMERELQRELADLDLSEYRNQPVPAEYKKAAEEYRRVIAGD